MRRERNIEYDEHIGAHFGESMPIDAAEMRARTWRFGQLTPSPQAFLDCQLPGHVRTLFSALGRGADDENLNGTAVEQAENYHIDFIKATTGNGAALHSHGSEETFIALTGRWRVYWGDDGRDDVVLEAFDGVVVPAGVLRGFENVGADDATLLAILGAHNAGHCVWAKSLRRPFADAKTRPSRPSARPEKRR